LARLEIHASISGSKILVSDGKSVRQFQTAIPSLKLKSIPLVITRSQRTNEEGIVWQPIKKPRSLFCSQKVYDLEVANNHNYVVEQNIISHNSASKAAAEHLARAARVTFGLDVVTTRASNNYGPYQFPEKLIPLMIANAVEDRELPVYGDGMNVRDWLYVEDCCRAIDAALHRGKSGEVYNIGSRAEKTNLEVVHALLDLLGKPRSLLRFVTDRPGHDRRYATDPAKIETELGWKPRESFESGLAKTVRWYKENADWVARARSGQYRNYYEKMYGAREWSEARDE
jgi:dTDP-D-glucose 4,6-dehydratase